jgi:hypothetical protein
MCHAVHAKCGLVLTTMHFCHARTLFEYCLIISAKRDEYVPSSCNSCHRARAVLHGGKRYQTSTQCYATLCYAIPCHVTSSCSRTCFLRWLSSKTQMGMERRNELRNAQNLSSNVQRPQCFHNDGSLLRWCRCAWRSVIGCVRRFWSKGY